MVGYDFHPPSCLFTSRSLCEGIENTQPVEKISYPTTYHGWEILFYHVITPFSFLYSFQQPIRCKHVKI